MAGYIFILLFFILFFPSAIFSQDNIKNYEPPKVIEGSNLTINSYPRISTYRVNEFSSNNITTFNVNFQTDYVRWKFTDRLNYTLRSGVSMSLYRSDKDNSYESEDRYYGSFGMNVQGGASYYLYPNCFYAGSYISAYTSVSTRNKPYHSAALYPNIGYGKLVDAFIVRETSNFEDILLKEDYIKRKFDKKTNDMINELLDRRNGTEFLSKYKDDNEIEFFTVLEALLLKNGVIEKPLNARTTLLLFRTLYNSSFVLFPIFRGFQTQAELEFDFDNGNDTLSSPKVLTLSSIYGLPLSQRTSLVFSGFFSFPVNKNYNRDYYGFNVHSPIALRSGEQFRNNFFGIVPNVFFSYNDIFSYKAAAGFNIFHNIARTVGLSGAIRFNTGKKRDEENTFDYNLQSSILLIYNILSKLRLTGGLFVSNSPRTKYSVNLQGGFTYIIF